MSSPLQKAYKYNWKKIQKLALKRLYLLENTLMLGKIEAKRVAEDETVGWPSLTQ